MKARAIVAILGTTLLTLSPVPFIQAQSPNLQELQKLQKQLQHLTEENRILKIRKDLQEELQDLKQENQALKKATTLGPKTALATSGVLPQNDNHGGIAKRPFTELPKEVQERFHDDSAKAGPFNAAQQAAVTQSNAAAAAAVAQFNAAAAQRQQEQEAAAQAARAQKTRIQGFVSRKTNDGLIVELSVQGGVSHNATDVPMGINNPIGGPGWRGSNRVFLRGYPDQENLADDNLVDAVAYESGTASLGSSTYRCYTFFSR